MWDATFNRDPADLGPAHAARRAAEDVERYAPHRPLVTALAELRAAWNTEQDFRDAIGRTTRRRDAVAVYGNVAAERLAEIDADLAELTDELHAASKRVRIRLREPAIRTLAPGRIEQERADWLHQRRQSQQAAQQTARSHQPYPGYMQTPDRRPVIGR